MEKLNDIFKTDVSDSSSTVPLLHYCHPSMIPTLASTTDLPNRTNGTRSERLREFLKLHLDLLHRQNLPKTKLASRNLVQESLRLRVEEGQGDPKVFRCY